ncbi:MAG: fluoride efflux transporter FluC [Rhodoglobus sp.]
MIVGGMVGTGLRLGLDAVIPHTDDSFPVSTLIANVVGAFVLGVLVARLWERAPVWLRAGLGVGLLGSFTTFSALAVSLVTLSTSGQWMTAALYLALTLLLGFGAAAAGLTLGRGRARWAPIDEVNE